MSEQYYHLYKRFVPAEELEDLIQQTFAFKKAFYHPERLADHTTYLADEKPRRTSHAYAVSRDYAGGILPAINLSALEDNLLIQVGEQVMYQKLGLSTDNRCLFNVQEYYGSSEAVPKHNDGELLEFKVREDGSLYIIRSIRPEKVAVLTLVNSSVDGGTRVHFPDGTSEVVRAEAGDLLVFDNLHCLHSVDPLYGHVARPDGLLRMTIGWRSLGEKTYYENTAGIFQVGKTEAEKIIQQWYENEWPAQWAKIQAETQQAAF